MKRLLNKVAVVTGGNSGIGKAIAQRFLEEGASVVILGRDQEKLKQAEQELSGNLVTIVGDVTRTDDLHRLFNETINRFGKIDSLVANSGVGERLHIKDVTEENFDYLVDINYRGLYFTVKYALEHLKPKASIILIASIAAHITAKRQSVYASTKAATMKLAQNLAYDLADNLIRVNSISPGYIRTPIFDSRLAINPNYLNEKEVNIPLKRIGNPEDIANAALFLASDESSYITGTDLRVDGGYTASHPAEL